MSEVHRAESDKRHEDTEEDKRKLFQERVWLEQQKRELESERAQLEQDKRDFRLEQDMTADRNRALKKQLEQEEKLFDMKWKILEEELRRLADDKRKMEQEKKEYLSNRKKISRRSHELGLFFVGVDSKQTLKKRYKDLIKIFHPDNQAGDKSILQEINREYDRLKQRMKA